MVRRRKPLLEGLAAEAEADTARELNRRKVAKAATDERKVAALNARVRELEADLLEAEAMRGVFSYVRENPLAPVSIKRREKAGTHEATAFVILSDLHLEEVVDPAEVNGCNEFNPTIAADRMDRLAVGTAWHIEVARSGYQIRELFLPCLGDVTTNYLRPEDMHGNAMTPMQGLVFASGEIVRYVRTVLARCPYLERVYMPMVPGNHDRLSFSRSTPFNKRVGMSSAPVLSHIIATALADEPRFVLELAGGEHHYTEIYGHTVRGMHGDRFNYAGGVGGIYVPARRHVMGLNKARHAHLTMFGHWHTAKMDDLWISNGSLIGPNAYSLAKALDPEPPAQMFGVLDRDRGKRFVGPIHVANLDRWY